MVNVITGQLLRTSVLKMPETFHYLILLQLLDAFDIPLVI
jgi:hypothetical protein